MSRHAWKFEQDVADFAEILQRGAVERSSRLSLLRYPHPRIIRIRQVFQNYLVGRDVVTASVKPQAAEEEVNSGGVEDCQVRASWEYLSANWSFMISGNRSNGGPRASHGLRSSYAMMAFSVRSGK
jgi:hypothetical protein